MVGTGEPGYKGVGGPALEAQLTRPVDVAFDSDGNMYIAERLGARVVKVDTSGVLTLVAGLDGASAVATDADGSLFAADPLNHRVRKVDGEGSVTTVAGTGKGGFSGDGGPATEAPLNQPGGIAVDPEGNLYIHDFLNYRIRRVD